MPYTRWSQTLIPTLRQAPAEAEVPSHQLLIRAGYIHRLGTGVYDYLPLGLRSLRRAAQIVREEMDAIGAVEVMLPTLQPIELWERTGRRNDYGDNLFVLTDRHGREQALGPTHEEVITELVASHVRSHRQLPLSLYQIQTKFRDEFRPRFGVLRSREFLMKDAYSFHLTLESLDATYQAMYDAYRRIFTRCGIPFEIVEAESGPIGGSASHEFMVPSPTGEDTILKSSTGGYAANVEKCVIGPRPHDLQGPPTGDLETLPTPGCASIEDVGKFLKVKPKNLLKTLLYTASVADQRVYLLAIVRGDHEVNEAKLRSLARQTLGAAVDVTLAPDAAARADGFALGYLGPHAAVGRRDTHLFIDPDAAQPGFWAAGANRHDHHVKHFNWQRDLLAHHVQPTVADLRNAMDGDPTPDGQGTLIATKGIEIGHVFKLGTKYSLKLDAKVLTDANEQAPIIMGCYGIGVNRILAAAIECDAGHDENGIRWPRALAPYDVVITPIKFEGRIAQVALQLAQELTAAGLEVLLDDRDERPGVKFKDAELIGIPLRITLGDKALADGHVELNPRDGSLGPKGELVPLATITQRLLPA